MKSRVLPLFLRRGAALALLGILICALVFGVVIPLMAAYVDARSSTQQLQSAISKIQATKSELPKLRKEDAQLRNSNAQTLGTLNARNESLAAAELQNRVKSLVESIHGELQSTQVLASRDEEDLRRVAIHCQITADIGGLQRALYTLESSSDPFLFVDNVDIRAQPRGRRQPAATGADLDASFELYAYLARAK